MTSSANSLDAARDISQDTVRAGFEELARFLHAAPARSAVLIPAVTTLSTSCIADDPARVGLDELERTMQTARRQHENLA